VGGGVVPPDVPPAPPEFGERPGVFGGELDGVPAGLVGGGVVVPPGVLPPGAPDPFEFGSAGAAASATELDIVGGGVVLPMGVVLCATPRVEMVALGLRHIPCVSGLRGRR
jgi:hypothetical protein